MGRFVRAFIEILRLAVAREQLPEPPSAAPSSPSPAPAHRRGPSRSALFEREHLPLDPEVPRAPRRPALRELFRREELALEPEAPPRPRRGILRIVLAPEQFPGDLPPEQRPRRSRWFAWLLAPERIDPP